MTYHPLVRSGVPLASMTTYKVGGDAEFFAEPEDLEELRSILAVTPKEVDITVLGRGSNVVISDRGIGGLVLRLSGSFFAVDFRSDGTIVAGGALPLAKLARESAKEGLLGLEFYIGIPGTVGGAVVMNAGGHGSDTAAVLESAEIVDLRSGELTVREGSTLGLSYRSSNISEGEIVCQATFRAVTGDRDEIEEKLIEITRWRRENQPGGTLNAGSVFKNPEGDSAGAIIDRCGLKGFSVGPIKVSDIHANFMTADKNATADEIYLFMMVVKGEVLEKEGINLEPEIRFLGEFSEPETTR